MKVTSNWHLDNIYKKISKTNMKILTEIWNTFPIVLKKETPKKTGLLRKNWNKNFNKINKNILIVENDVAYGKFVNYWTSRQRAQNFVEKSITKNKKMFHICKY